MSHPSLIMRVVAGLAALSAALLPATEIIRPKVVVVAMFEIGQDTGDKPGEFQFWVEREKLDRIIPLPAAYHAVRANADGSVIGIVTGVGNTNAAASIMALGLDPRFDLSKSYWVIAGIAGISPAVASVGSAVWADYVVEGDLGHEIDAREIPADWKTGYVPLRKSKPYELPLLPAAELVDNCYEINPGLLHWAYELTKDTPLADNDGLRAFRSHYTATPPAQQPPSVLIGANLASSTFWHGKLLHAWAQDWVAYYTAGRGRYVTTAMEDTGTLRTLTNLTRAGRADVNRALVLRTASNFDMQAPGITAAQSLARIFHTHNESVEQSVTWSRGAPAPVFERNAARAPHPHEISGLGGEKLGNYAAFVPSLEAAHAVGSRVVHALVEGWKIYETTPPVAAAK